MVAKRIRANSLFPDDPIDRATLNEIARRSVPRTDLAGVFACVAKSTDLFEFGYIVAHWVRPGAPGSEVLEFVPRFSDLPRLTVTSYTDQALVHESIGARVVSPGRRFRMFQHARVS